MKSRTQTPRDFTFPPIPLIPSLPAQTIKTQAWCKAVTVGSNDIAIQTTNGDVLVLCSFELDSNQQQTFTRLQLSDLSNV